MKEKHMKRAEPAISINYCTELSKTQFFPVNIGFFPKIELTLPPI